MDTVRIMLEKCFPLFAFFLGMHLGTIMVLGYVLYLSQAHNLDRLSFAAYMLTAIGTVIGMGVICMLFQLVISKKLLGQ